MAEGPPVPASTPQLWPVLCTLYLDARRVPNHVLVASLLACSLHVLACLSTLGALSPVLGDPPHIPLPECGVSRLSLFSLLFFFFFLPPPTLYFPTDTLAPRKSPVAYFLIRALHHSTSPSSASSTVVNHSFHFFPPLFSRQASRYFTLLHLPPCVSASPQNFPFLKKLSRLSLKSSRHCATRYATQHWHVIKREQCPLPRLLSPL